MEIKNYTLSVNAYRYNAESASDRMSRRDVSVKVRNTDKAEFTARAGVNFSESLKTAAREAAEASASPERLSELADKIASGSYNVPTEDVAASILGL